MDENYINEQRAYYEKRKEQLALDERNAYFLDEIKRHIKKLLDEKFPPLNVGNVVCESVKESSNYIQNEKNWVDQELKALKIAELELKLKQYIEAEQAAKMPKI